MYSNCSFQYVFSRDFKFLLIGICWVSFTKYTARMLQVGSSDKLFDTQHIYIFWLFYLLYIHSQKQDVTQGQFLSRV